MERYRYPDKSGRGGRADASRTGRVRGRSFDEPRRASSDDLLALADAVREVGMGYGEPEPLTEPVVTRRRGHLAVVADLPTAVANGRGERWVEGIFGLHARHLGNAVGYDTIAAGGDHANTLHWIRNDGVIADGDLLLMMGAGDIGHVAQQIASGGFQEARDE